MGIGLSRAWKPAVTDVGNGHLGTYGPICDACVTRDAVAVFTVRVWKHSRWHCWQSVFPGARPPCRLEGYDWETLHVIAPSLSLCVLYASVSKLVYVKYNWSEGERSLTRDIWKTSQDERSDERAEPDYRGKSLDLSLGRWSIKPTAKINYDELSKYITDSNNISFYFIIEKLCIISFIIY